MRGESLDDLTEEEGNSAISSLSLVPSLFTVPMPHIHAVEFQSSEGIVHVQESDESLACWFAGGDVYAVLSYVESYKVIQSQNQEQEKSSA